MVQPVRIEIDADHCCNWRCCWGCRDKEREVKHVRRKSADRVKHERPPSKPEEQIMRIAGDAISRASMERDS